MEEVKNWLCENELEELIDVFSREKINSMRRVRRLTEDLVREFIPEVGPRGDFMECLSALKAADREASKSTTDNNSLASQTNVQSGLILESSENSENLNKEAGPSGAINIGNEYVCGIGTEISDVTNFTDENGCPLSVLKVTEVRNFDQDSGIEFSGSQRPAKRAGAANNSSVLSASTSGNLARKKRKGTDTLPSKHLLSFKGKDNIKSLDLRELLESDLASNAALEYYDLHGCLTESGRQHIVSTVTKELMRVNYSPSQEEYQLITDKICQLFPHEDPEIYYCPPQESYKNCSGKLPNRVRNVKFTLAKQNTPATPRSCAVEQSLDFPSTSSGKRNSKTTKPAKLSGSTDRTDSSIISAISVLKHRSTDSWPELLKNWSITHALRFKYLRDTRPTDSSNLNSTEEVDSETEEDALVTEYFKEWTVLSAPNGDLLICQDFAELYPGKENGLLANWDKSRKLIVDLAEREISKSDNESLHLIEKLKDLPEAKQDPILFRLLAAICCKRGRGKGAAKVPSVIEACKSFIIHVNREVRNRRSVLSSKQQHLQPFVILVGASLSNITASYVQVDNVRYKLRTPLAAVDTCFKAFHSLDAAYPPESAAIWLFIQRFFFQLFLEEDPNIARVAAVLSSMNALQAKFSQTEF